MAEQAAMAAAATVMVGPHGAGLTNMLWMQQGTAVVRHPEFYPWLMCIINVLQANLPEINLA